MNREPQVKPYIDLPRMAEKAQRMVKESLDAFVARDPKSDINEPRILRREWVPGWQGTRRTVRWSLQLCIPGAETFPSPQAYAAQVNWARGMRRLLSREPDWRGVPPPPSYDTPAAVTRAAWGAGTVGSLHLSGKGEELGVRFLHALRATGPGWEHDVVRDWRRPKKATATPKRSRKAVAT